MRTSIRLVLGCGLLVAAAATSVAEEDAVAPGWVRRNFVSAPTGDHSVSKNKTLTWVAMLGDRRLRHLGRLGAAAFSPDGTWVVSADVNTAQIKLWETATGREIRTLDGHANGFLTVGVSPDGTKVISGGLDRRVRLWDASTGKLLHVLKGHAAYPAALTLSSDGKQVVSAAASGTVKVWDAQTGREVRTYSMGAQPFSFAYSRNGKWLVCGSRLGEIRITEAVTGKQRALLTGHPSTISCVAVTNDGNRIATGDWKGVARIWDTATGRTLRSLRGPKPESVDCLDMTPDGSRIVTGGHGKTVRIWDGASGKLLHALEGQPWYVSAVAVSADGRSVFSGDWHGYCFLWNAQTGKAMPPTAERAQSGWALIAMEQGTRICTNGPPGSLAVWDVATGTVLHSLKAPKGSYHVTRAAGGGSWLASGSTYDGKLRIWEASSGKPLRAVPTPQPERWSKMLDRDAFGAIAMSRDGAHIISANEDGVVRIWERSTGKHMRSFRAHGGYISALAFRPDGQEFISGGGRDKRIRIWDTHTGKERISLVGHKEGIGAVAVTPDGRWIVSGSQDHTIKVWDAATGKVMRTLTGHTHTVDAVRVSADGRWLLSAGWDNTLRVWDMRTGELRDSIRVAGGPTEIVMVGNRIWVSCRDSTVCGYDFKPIR